MRTCIVVPIYKTEFDWFEKKSIDQCFRIFRNHEIFFVCPEQLDISTITETYHGQPMRFPEKYFININGYNRLLLSKKFYKRFREFDYILIHQLDAYVFNDELEYWCGLNYDYIGGPWSNIYIDDQRGILKSGVGNGGLSLRKVSSFLKVLDSFQILYSIRHLYRKSFKAMNRYNFLIVFLKLQYFILFRNKLFAPMNGYDRNEDIFWGVVASEKNKWFAIPDAETAAKFSIDDHPEYFIKFVDDKPMGCHGWHNNYDNFWNRYIK